MADLSFKNCSLGPKTAIFGPKKPWNTTNLCGLLGGCECCAMNTRLYPLGHFRLPTTCSCQLIVSAVSTDTVFSVGRKMVFPDSGNLLSRQPPHCVPVVCQLGWHTCLWMRPNVRWLPQSVLLVPHFRCPRNGGLECFFFAAPLITCVCRYRAGATMYLIYVVVVTFLLAICFLRNNNVSRKMLGGHSKKYPKGMAKR